MAEAYRALVVEDDAVARDAAATALQEEGFVCALAEDGAMASAALERAHFDVVVTDLRLPRRNGHALAVELTNRAEPRPLVVVLTGVLDPRLVKDLIARGVDDVAFKPVDFCVFGAKIRALCDRRRRQISACDSGEHALAINNLCEQSFARIAAGEIERRLDSLAGSLPVSEVAVDVMQLVQDGTRSAREVALAIARDPLLTVEVLRLANSARIHPSGKRIDCLEEAVTWIGDRQIGELAMASTTLSSLAQVRMPWMDSHLLWLRSVAGSRSMRLLRPAAELGADEEGLFLSSLVLPLGRVVLSLAFSELYERMIAHCQQSGDSLAELERRMFAVSPGRAMAGILARWNISPALYKPLQHASSAYSEIATLNEPLRSKVERLRVADLLGQLAVGRFEPWCEVDFPPAETTSRLRLEDPAFLVNQVRSELCAAQPSGSSAAVPPRSDFESAEQRQKSVRYYKLSLDCRDLLAVMLQTMNVVIERATRNEACQAFAGVVNCLDVSPERLEWFLDDAIADSKRVLITNTTWLAHSKSWSPTVQVPCSYHVLASAVEAATARH